MCIYLAQIKKLMIKISFPFISTHRESDLKNRRSVVNESESRLTWKLKKYFYVFFRLKSELLYEWT